MDEALSVTDEGHWAVEAQTIPVNSEQEELDEPAGALPIGLNIRVSSPRG